MLILLRRSNVSGSPQIYVINTYAKIRSRNQTATLSLRTYNVKLLAGRVVHPHFMGSSLAVGCYFASHHLPVGH